MIDSHCHLHAIDEGLDEILKECIGLTKIVNIFEYRDRNHIERFKHFKSPISLIYACGIHPCEVDNLSLHEAYEWLIDNVKFIGLLGETGLDLLKHRNKVKQLEYYEMHVQIAKEYNKPIIIHSRHCEVGDLIELTKINNVWHSFSFGKEEAKKVLELDNSFLSFSGMVTFKSASNVREALEYCPLDRLLIETDCPFLTPEPLRGKKNKPHYIKYTYEFIARLKNISIENLIEQVEKNFHNFML